MNDSKEKVVHLEKKSLKRAIGAAELFSIGYGDVGSSLYYALGLTAFYALGATPIALAIAGFVFFCTSLTYAEMATTFPEPGGSATFSRYAFNDLISFIAGWGLLLDYIVTIAISAFAIPPYLTYLIPFPNTVPMQISITIGIILFLYVLNVIGIKYSGKFSLFLAIIALASQAIVIVIGAVLTINLPYIIDHLRIAVPQVDWSPSWPQFLTGVAMAMVAYTGIESITQLAAETRKPAISIPRAIQSTIYTLIAFYILIAFVALSVMTPQDLGTTYLQDPIAGIVAHLPFGGKWLTPWFALIAALILLIAGNAGLIGASRLTFSMGEYYQVPQFFYRMHPRFRTPYVSLGIFAFFSCVIVLLSRGKMLFLADLYNFGAQIAFFFAHLSLLVLRFKKPGLNRPFKAFWNIPIGKNRSIPMTAVIGAISTFIVWLIVVITKPDGRNLGIVWLILGSIMYFYYRRKKKIAPMGSLTIEKIKIPEYQRMHLKHILVITRAGGNVEALQTACQLATNFGAKITAVHILEVPASLPMHAPMADREAAGAIALKKAEAVAREYGLLIDLKLIRARSVQEAVLELVAEDQYDMVVVSSLKDELRRKKHFAVELERLLKTAPCRVLYCKS